MPKGRASLLVSLLGIPPAIKNSIDARTYLQNTILDEVIVVNRFFTTKKVVPNKKADKISAILYL
jgi:hypothetical protein